ncbi:cell division cycle 5 [Striga asiatica]|uniref:Cell division cycle 5 n=1 Tax=Striga asiatica TaxID=4170 RepID=A0A5A7NWK2_STRAF|nr:cell division cycle 5 [Striga asiatica]
MRIMIKGGVWKNTEDEILKAAVMKYGKNQWARISSLLVRKSAKQCKARWYEWLDPSIKKTASEAAFFRLKARTLQAKEWEMDNLGEGRARGKSDDFESVEIYSIEFSSQISTFRPLRKLLVNLNGLTIKHTEWTREEDEKLLHLAKLMPTQWRTIAPIVGRTPSQCLERYEKLLDAACAKDENYEPGDDPRKLRPGEIDPNPESKPARPDPVDMDEDEKEMLSEARARLANTRGKKAKRKAREKQLEEARRLASLQKRRELKAAGIDVRHRKRKRRGIDYNAEIPFEKKPPPGFYDVADEERPAELVKFPTTIEELEGERRVDREARLRKQDIARNKIAQRQDAPSAILQANRLNDPEAVRKRSKLILPAPQIPDHELEAIAKIGIASDLLGGEELTEGNAATRALLASYAQTPRQGVSTPMRTPQRTPAGKQDAIMMEAENQRRLTQSQTPLLGGDNPMLHPSDFSGVTPKKKDVSTPNPLLTPSAATPGLTPRIGMGGTPARDAYSLNMTPKGTPMRDELRINEDMDMLEGGRSRQSDLRKELISGLKNLPQPKNEYQIVAQPIPEEDEEPEEQMEEDMSDRIAREKAAEEARQQALLKKRSKVLQRELPRPPLAAVELIRSSLVKADEDKSSFVPPTLVEQADELVRKELLLLLEHDNAKYPLDEKATKEKKKGGKRALNGKSQSVPLIDEFEEDELKEANELIKDEAEFLRVTMGHENEPLESYVEAHKTCLDDITYFPTRSTYGLSSVASNTDKLAALQDEFENVKKTMDDEAKKAQRQEQKIKVLTNGYHMRAAKLWTKIESDFKQMDTAGTELECFRALQTQEKVSATHRVSNLWEEVQKQKELEHVLQKKYADLLSEQERLQNLMNAYRLRAEREAEIMAEKKNNGSDGNAPVVTEAEAEPEHVQECESNPMEVEVSGGDGMKSEQSGLGAENDAIMQEKPMEVEVSGANEMESEQSGLGEENDGGVQEKAAENEAVKSAEEEKAEENEAVKSAEEEKGAENEAVKSAEEEKAAENEAVKSAEEEKADD